LFNDQKKVLVLQPGQAVIFDIRLIHNATENSTNADRICFSLRITHKKSIYYDMLCETKNKNIVSVFEETHDIYLRDEWNSGKTEPVRKKIGHLYDIYSTVNTNKVEEKLIKQKSTNVIDFLRPIKKFFTVF
jgi:hypothetical protein